MNLFYNMKIRTKLMVSFLMVLLITLFIGFFSIRNLEKVFNVGNNIAEVRMPNIFYLSDMNTNTSDFRIAELQHIHSLTKEEMDGYEEQMEIQLNKIIKNQESYEKMEVH